MQIRFAALGGTEIDAELLEAGVAALGQRPDFEEVTDAAASSGTPFSIRVHPPWKGERSVWCVAQIEGENGITTLVEVARTIAAHTKKSVRAMASGVEGPAGMGRIEVSYRAYEITPDGMSSTLSFDEADELCGEADEDSVDELGDMLSILVGDSAVHAVRPANSGRAFRRRPLLEEPRLARLATAILAAKSVAFTPDAGDRIRVSLEGIDGAKQISLVTGDEADKLRRVTSR
jgi:hypothetical protein